MSSYGASILNTSFGTVHSVSQISASNGRRVYKVRGTAFEVDDRYTILNVVGHGAYGTVVAARDERCGREIAIKKVSRVFDDLIDGRRIWRELFLLRLLKQLGCRHIMPVYSILTPRQPIDTFREVYIVTELAETDLFQAIKKKTPTSLAIFKRIAAQVLRCVADLHAFGVIHRDMKPPNVLLDAAGDVSICDFGLARGGMHQFTEPLDLTDYVVTRWYRPPELLLMCRYHFPVDIWGVGCVLGEYIRQRPLFVGQNYIHQLRVVVQAVPPGDDLDFVTSRSALPFLQGIAKSYGGIDPLRSMLKGLPPEGVDFMEKLLAFAPNKRLTAQEALRHPFLETEGGDGRASYPPPPDDVDWSFDTGCVVSEAQLRRKIWDEIEHWQVNDDTPAAAAHPLAT